MAPFDETVGGMGSLAGVMLFLTTGSVVLRIIARRMQKSPFGADGWCVIPAWLCFVGITINAIYGMAHQLIAFPMPSDKSLLLSMFHSFASIFFTLDVLAIVSLGFTRISTLFFYRRIFVVRGRGTTVFSALTIFGIVIISLWMLGFIFLIIFVCGTNFGEFFTPKGDSSDCQAQNFATSFGTSSFILDILVLVLPIPRVLALHTTTGRKLAIIGVFLLAAAGVISSCARMVINYTLVANGPTVGHVDVFLINTRLYYFLMLEAGLVLVATNLPSLWYFLANGKVPERLVQSFRSLVSLQSNNSRSRNMQKDTSNDASSSNSGIETVQEFKVEYSARNNEVDPERLSH